MKYLDEEGEEITEDLVSIRVDYIDILRRSVYQLGTRLAEAEEELNKIQIVKE